MKIPTRPAPSVPQRDIRRENFSSIRANGFEKKTQTVLPKKKPPPRPPPPKFRNNDDKLAWPSSSNSVSLIDMPVPRSLSQKLEFSTSLIDLSSPPKENNFPVYMSNNDAVTVGNSSFFGDAKNQNLVKGISMINLSDNSWAANKPTIIRAKPQIKKESHVPKPFVSGTADDLLSYSPPMPTVPPPSPPKCVDEPDITSYGVALYNYEGTHKDDLTLQVNDVVIILHEINSDWFYGKVGDNEGLFPKNFIDVRVPFKPSQENVVTALYTFNTEAPEDLKLTCGQKVTVLKRISADWLYGESNGACGQFPVNFVNTVPSGF